MDGKKKLDFFAYGQYHALDKLIDTKKIAAIIEKEYGKQARENFEIGVASTIPEYSNIAEDVSCYIGTSARRNFGKPNMRNNSYFDTYGTSRQYILDSQGNSMIYNEPHSRKKEK